jgi:hypothetical protein
MKRLWFALVAVMLSTVALANPVPPKPQKPKPTPTTATSVSGSSATATATAGGGAGYGGVGFGGNATSGGSSSTVNVSQAEVPNSIEIRNTPDVMVMIASPTAPCRNTVGVGAGIPGFGLTVGASDLDVGCDTREDARLLFNMGLKDESIVRLCIKPEMATALGAKCPKPQVQ